MSKLIVTHLSPDLDAIASVWLIHRYMRGWKDADVAFVSSGRTLHDMSPDKNKDIIHVDTGLGKFDHHQTDEFTCATRLMYEWLKEKKYIKDADDEALERMVDVITRYDHFQEVLLHDAEDDMHLFSLTYVIFGLRVNQNKAHELVELGEQCLDGIFYYMKGIVSAEKIIEKGHVFDSYWGRTLVMETDNEKVNKAAFRQGYDMVVRHSPQYKNVSIKVHPKSKRKLSILHTLVTKNDPDAQWFYHASGRMLLNASTRATKDKVTKYSLPYLMRLIKSV